MESVKPEARSTVEAVAGVHLTQLAVGDRMSVQHYRIEPGAVVPEHAHPHEQAGVLHSGVMTLVSADGREQVIEAGESYVLAGEEAHAAENRGEEDVVGIDIFSPPRTDPDWQA